MINLNDLLFTKHRDYLVKYDDAQQVKAAHLAGKVTVLYFVPLRPVYSNTSSRSRSFLIDTYTYLLPDNNFEVVLVAYGTSEDKILSDSYTNSKKIFEVIFSCMPWTAIPFSDISSRERLASRFAIRWPSRHPSSVVIDSSGMVLQNDGCDLFKRYGGLGYPFSDEWIQHLEIQDVATAKKPSLKALLASPKRDYVISNKGNKVLIDALGEKVVALYFYEEGITPTGVTANIKRAYKEFALNKSCFEVVLVYLHGTSETIGKTSEESFRNTFENMPWLAIPFKDPKCERLARFFGYPNKQSSEEAPTLVIFGPHGEFIEPWGADIMYKFKLPAYPFTRERVAKLYTEKIQQLKLEMLWEQNTIFRRKDASEGTSDEFEVIYIMQGETESPYKLQIADLPCFFSLASDLLPIDLSQYHCYCHLLLARNISFHSCDQCDRWTHRSRYSSILGFDEYGRVVRKSSYFTVRDSDFPFCGNMEEEAFYELKCYYSWGCSDDKHRGLRINSYHVNKNLPRIYSSKKKHNKRT
ncbi:putative nucleoredoxin 1 isoform X2 [Apium graveolens]|uniref:putative nucleoredoxin 1 isoform X2 n=1 Tax=Apium graveolens TaxID=4045 RepID=UPI003D7AD7CF